MDYGAGFRVQGLGSLIQSLGFKAYSSAIVFTSKYAAAKLFFDRNG
jgi:hypothetical protein